MPIWASIPAAIELSTGFTDDACTRTSTSLSAGVGSARSSFTTGAVSGLFKVMARMGSPSVAISVEAENTIATSIIEHQLCLSRGYDNQDDQHPRRAPFEPWPVAGADRARGDAPPASRAYRP